MLFIHELSIKLPQSQLQQCVLTTFTHTVLPSLSSHLSSIILTTLHGSPVHCHIKYKLVYLPYKLLATRQPTYMHSLMHHCASRCTLAKLRFSPIW